MRFEHLIRQPSAATFPRWGRLCDLDAPLLSAVEAWCEESGEDKETKKFTVRALLYGCVMMTSSPDARSTLPDLLRRELEEIF